MMVTIPAAKRVESAPDIFSFEVPKGFDLTELCKRAKEKHGNYFHVILGTPKRPRTLKQNNASWGWCTDIAEQLSGCAEYEGYSIESIRDRVYEAMKRLAIIEVGWPTVISPIDGSIEPVSQSIVSVEQDNGLLSVIKKFADENNLWLTEIIDGKPVRCIGGKPIG